jgi:hypothetical protein
MNAAIERSSIGTLTEGDLIVQVATWVVLRCSLVWGEIPYVRFGGETVPAERSANVADTLVRPEVDVASKRTKDQAPTPAGKARSNINDVASLAKVSRQTVTNVLYNRTGDYSEDTRDRVLRAIEELDYQPHRAARSLRSQRTMQLGYHMPAEQLAPITPSSSASSRPWSARPPNAATTSWSSPSTTTSWTSSGSWSPTAG